MAIPALDQDGFLPLGIHDCTLEEIRARFGSFQMTDRRPNLFAKLEAYVSEARASRLLQTMLVNGSFVTAKPDPNDVDLILVLAADHDFSSDLTPAAYNIVSKRMVHRRFGFDLLVAREGSLEYGRWSEFFQQVRLEPGRKKGILRLRI
jgi:uncharacterized protein DUF6932